MAKKRAECPDCGHRFTVQIGGRQIKKFGVRSRRVTGNQFAYTITTPVTMSNDARLTTVTDDLTLSAAVSLPVGAGFGLLASIFAPDYAVELIGLGASGGTALAWGWLCAEHNQRLKSVVPWFMEQRRTWASARDETISGNVELKVITDTGQTKTGRTIQYFGTLPVDTERFSEWAAAVLGTQVPAQSLAIANWTGKGKLFSRKEYEGLLALLRKSQAVVLRASEGNILTGGGRRALRQHLKAHPPTPAGSAQSG